VGDEDRLVGRDDPEIGGFHRARHQISDQRRNSDRRQARRRIAADDQFETVKRASQWCAERAGNPGGGAASDENAKVATAQPKRHADTRGDAAGKLRITRFQTDGRAHPARPHRLGGDDHASQQRHATAVQGVSFDRIDFPFRTPSPDNFAGDPE
jgi:hypothetical protein